MHLQLRRKTDSLYHTCLKQRLIILAFAAILPGWASAQVIRFRDVTTEMKAPGWTVNGVSAYGHGSAWADVSGDSLPDLYIASAVRQANRKVPETLYISHAGAAYTEEDGSRGVSDSYGSTGSHGVIFADYDNDGDLDIFNATTDDQVRLYRNKGDGYFDNVTTIATLKSSRVTYAGYGEIGYGTRALVAFDADSDGDMDLYATNWGPVEDIKEVPWVTPAQPNEFFINNGNGTFTLSQDRGCTPVNPSNEGTQGVTAIDIDEDGDMDLFVSHRNYAFLGYNSSGVAQFGRGATPAPNDLFLNDGTGHFVEANIRDYGLYSESNDVNGVTFADYDNDGDLDAFIAYADDTRPKVRVLQNNGKGIFKFPSADVVIDQWGFTTFLFDMDNDGDLDIFAPRTRERGRIYLNDGAGQYILQSNTGVEITMDDPRGGSIADMDNDGDLDIYCADANKDAVAAYSNRLYRNETATNNGWLKIWGRGPKGDLGAFGTKVWLFEKGFMGDMTRLVGYKQIINGYGYLAQDDIIQHFGTGTRDSVDVRIKMLDGTTLNTRLKTRTKFFFSKPVNLVLKDGNNQNAVGGEKLALPLRVVVTDAQGKAVQGTAVIFSADSGGGHFTQQQPVYTDASGIARVDYYVGNMAGTQRISAAMGGQSVEFAATVVSSGPAVLALVSGSGQSAYAGQVLTDSIRVRVTNSNGVGQSNQPVQFEVIAGAGRIKPGDLTILERLTNSAGIAVVDWQLGATPNTAQTLRITSAANGQALSGSPIDVQATALERIQIAGTPSELLFVSGEGQSGTAGELLSAPFIVQLVDSVGRPCSNYDITFQVIAGNGLLGGADQQIVQTDMDGRASASLTLGVLAGKANNRVRARYNGMAREIFFAASVIAAPANTLLKKEGDNQVGKFAQTLPKTLQVQVIDQYGNPCADHSVTFAIASLDGWVNDQRTVTLKTDTLGLAQAALKLGSTPGVYMVAVSSSYNAISLTGSPVIFSATAISDPAMLQLASADSASGLAGQPLAEPLRVRVTDLTGYPVPNHLVTFWVRRGGGNLEGRTEVVKTSDINGIVSVTPTLGSAIGAANNVFEAQSFQEAGLHLLGSPRRFYVSAKKSLAYQIYVAGGNGLSAQAGEVLPQPLAVRIVDKAQQPIAGQEVLFAVVKGTGRLGAGQSSAATVQSNAAGIAQISFRLGSELGSQAHVVNASADNGIAALINSPLTFTAAAPYGQPDTSASTITITSPVVANGVAEAEVRIRLIDTQGHPVPGERLILQVSGNGNRITQPEQPTDAQGEATALVSSTVAESKTVRAYLSGKSKYLQRAPIVAFVAGSPQRIAVISGDYQTGIIQSVLEKPIVARLEDFYQNPVANAALNFLPALGSGETSPKQDVKTDKSGLAQVAWILGPSVGQQELNVVAVGTSVSKKATATAALPQQIQLITAAGEGQFAAPGTLFTDSLTVRVVDDRNAPIYGVGVTFAVIQGSASLSPGGAVMSDRFGLARVRLAAGSDIGAVRVRALTVTGGSVDFTESVSTAIPERITLVYGDSLADLVGSLVYPLTVRVTDYFSNPVANVPIYYEALTAGAQLPAAQPLYTTDDGQVAATVRLGTRAGTYLFQARSSHLTGSPVQFALLAKAGSAAEMAVSGGDQQSARPLKALPSPVKVHVDDQYGNGVPGHVVEFAPISGGGSVNPLIVVTDNQGFAAAQWTLGGSGTQRLQAKCQSLPGKQAIFSARVIENLAPVIYVVADTTILETQTLVFEVVAADPDGGTAALAAQNLPTGAAFDSINSRLFIWRPDFSQQGIYAITFIARDENGGQTNKVVTVRVQNLNRPPAIHAFQPESFYLSAPTFKPVIFKVQASDQDGDALSYTWRLNGRIVGQNDSLSILTGTTLPAQFTLIVTVSDQHDSVSQAWSVQQATGVAADPGNAKLPEHNRLVQNYPNPFNPETTISYELVTAQQIEIRIFNMSGQLVRTLYSGTAQAGYHHLRWNGQADGGEMVPSGIYPCVLSAENCRQAIKLVFLK